MFVVGLTGGIGTGKSEVARILQELGAVVLDADKVGHEAYKPHSEAWQEVVETFGEGVLQRDGTIDRKALGALVFGDPGAREKLNSIMHPRMAKVIEERIRHHKKAGAQVVVVEAALLIEAGWRYLVDEVWATWTPEDEAIDRVHRRSNLPRREIKRRIDAQMPAAEKLNQADVVVENRGGLEELRAQVERLWDGRVKRRIR